MKNSKEMCLDMDAVWCDILDLLDDNIYNDIVNLFQQKDSSLIPE